MEKLLLETLEWKVNATTPSLILESFIYCFDLPQSKRNNLWLYADVFLGIVQSDYDFIGYLPSIQTAASLRCACKCMDISLDLFDTTMQKEIDMFNHVTSLSLVSFS